MPHLTLTEITVPLQVQIDWFLQLQACIESGMSGAALLHYWPHISVGLDIIVCPQIKDENSIKNPPSHPKPVSEMFSGMISEAYNFLKHLKAWGQLH